MSNKVEHVSKVSFRSIGRVGLHHYGPYVYEEFLPELRWPYAGKIYQEMADNDPVIGGILYLMECLIRATEWTCEADTDSVEDRAAAEFIESCMHDMEVSWADTISEVLSMFTYGFSFHEVNYKIRRGPNERSGKYKSRYSDGKIGWRDIPIRSQRTLNGWVFDKHGNVTGFEQTIDSGAPYSRVVIPLSKGLLFRTRVSRNNPEGKSLLRNAYRPWFFKKHFEEIEGIGIERDLAGLPVLQAPSGMDLWNEDDKQMRMLRAQAEQLIANIRRDSEEGILLPPGWTLSLLASGSSRQINIGETIERYDNRIAITLLSDLILLGNKAGSYALAETKSSLLADSLQTQLATISDVFNKQAVPKLLQVNNMAGIAHIKATKVATPSIKELALMLRAMGLSIDEDINLQNQIRERMNLDALSQEEHEQIYAVSAEENLNNNTRNSNGYQAASDPDDEAQKELEQNELNYIGGEM